jgi:hypothetical protein
MDTPGTDTDAGIRITLTTGMDTMITATSMAPQGKGTEAGRPGTVAANPAHGTPSLGPSVDSLEPRETPVAAALAVDRTRVSFEVSLEVRPPMDQWPQDH